MTDGPPEQLSAIFDRAGADACVHAVDLASGAEVGLQPDEPAVSASVFKLPVLLEVCRQFATGRLEPQTRVRVPAARRTLGPTGLSALCDDVEMSVRDLATMMIAVSDNTATDVVAELVGLDAVNATMVELGLTSTVLVEDCRGLIDGLLADLGGHGPEALARGAVPPAVLAGLRALVPALTNRTTARETTTLLAAIWRDDAGPPDACAEARRILGLQVWPHRLRSGFPGEVRTSGKTGTLPGVRNEVGVLEYPDGGRYAVAVFTRARSWADPQPDIDTSIGAAARLAVEHLRGTCRLVRSPVRG